MKPVLVVVQCLFAAGCASQSTATGALPGPAPAAAPPVIAAPTAAPAPARSRTATLPRRIQEQVYRVQSVVRIERDSSGERDEVELQTTAVITLALQADSSSIRGSGIVDSFTVRGVERLGRNAANVFAQPIRVPFELTIDSVQLRVSVQPPLANECDRVETGATALVRDVVVRTPRTLNQGDSWTDSTTSFVCRSMVPMTVRTMNRYVVDRVDVRDGDGTVELSRASETRLEGTSTGAWRSVSIRGNGNGTQRIRLDARTGAVIEIDGQSTLVLESGAERVTQRTSLRVRR